MRSRLPVVSFLLAAIGVGTTRAQFNLGGGFASDKCSMRIFEQRVKQIDKSCCVGKGKDTCPNGAPLRCDLECAIDYLPFFEECQNLIQNLAPRPTPVIVVVGSSSTNKKVINVENVVSCTSGRGVGQSSRFHDTFAVSVAANHKSITVSTAWSATVGDCRYKNGRHSNYKTLHKQPSVKACKGACTDDPRCHAFDMNFPFRGTCWLFSNVAGNQKHSGNGVKASRCWIHRDTKKGGWGHNLRVQCVAKGMMEQLVQLKNQCEHIPTRESVDLIGDLLSHCKLINVDCSGAKRGCRGGPPLQCASVKETREGVTTLAEVVSLGKEISYSGYCLESIAGGGWTFVNEERRSTTDINDIFPEQLHGYHEFVYNTKGMKYNEVLVRRTSATWCDSWGHRHKYWVNLLPYR